MDDDGARPPTAIFNEHIASMLSPGSTSHPVQPGSSKPKPTSKMSTAFEFTAGASDISMPSFDPAISAFADMSSQPPDLSPGLKQKGPMASMCQPECFQRRDLHDKKRFRTHTKAAAPDPIDYWMNFDDAEKIGSFEIDFSKRNDSMTLNRSVHLPSSRRTVEKLDVVALTHRRSSNSMNGVPGLGSGLYSTAMASFREEDFLDANFDAQLSDDEEMLDSTNSGTGPAEDERLAPPPLPRPTPPVSIPSAAAFATSSRHFPSAPQMPDRFHPALRVGPPMPDYARTMRRGIWDAFPRTTNRALTPDEQRRLLDIALNNGRLPGTYLPPNGFGLGFGAGLGALPPSEFEKRAGSSSTEPERKDLSGRTLNGEESQDRDSKHHLKKATVVASSSKFASSRKPTCQGDPGGKPKSADRMAHNDVERKYRTNLKIKIAELRDAVPTLQSTAQEGDSEGGTSHQGAPKVSKGTVLTKATEYIQQLEQRNKAITLEHQHLARRLQAFETLFNNSTRPDMMPNHSMTLFDPRGFC